MAAFLRAVEKGRVPKGSYLIIENLDRLSREHIQPALILFLNLLQAGVRIVQLVPTEMVFDDKSDTMPIMLAIVELSRGHSESAMKSERVGKAWAAKRACALGGRPQPKRGGAVMTWVVPAWLKVEGGRVVPVPEKVAAVRRIYRMAAEGYGIDAIARQLNAEGVPPIGTAKHWANSTVGKILAERKAMGEHQPRRWRKNVPGEPIGDPIPDYFPAAVTEQEWYAARAAIASRAQAKGRTGKGVANVFRGLLRDARDGGPLHVRGHSGKRYLTPYRGMLGLGGDRTAFPLPVFETAILSRLREVDPREILPEGDGGAADTIRALAGRLEEIDRQLVDLTDRLVSGAGKVGVIEAAARRLEDERPRVAEALAAAQAKAASPLAEAWGEFGTLADVLASAPDPAESRLRLRGVLRRLVCEVQCLFVAVGQTRVAAVQVFFAGSDRSRSYLISYTPAMVAGKVRREAVTEVRSFSRKVGKADFDLRKPNHVAALERVLADL